MLQRFIVSYGKGHTFTLETFNLERAKKTCPGATIAPCNDVPEERNGLAHAFQLALGM